MSSTKRELYIFTTRELYFHKKRTTFTTVPKESADEHFAPHILCKKSPVHSQNNRPVFPPKEPYIHNSAPRLSWWALCATSSAKRAPHNHQKSPTYSPEEPHIFTPRALSFHKRALPPYHSPIESADNKFAPHILYKKSPIHPQLERDTHTGASRIHWWSVRATCPPTERPFSCSQRALCIHKEPYVFTKSPMYSQRALCIHKEPYVFTKSPTYSQRALCIHKEPYVFTKSPMYSQNEPCVFIPEPTDPPDDNFDPGFSAWVSIIESCRTYESVTSHMSLSHVTNLTTLSPHSVLVISCHAR